MPLEPLVRLASYGGRGVVTKGGDAVMAGMQLVDRAIAWKGIITHPVASLIHVLWKRLCRGSCSKRPSRYHCMYTLPYESSLGGLGVRYMEDKTLLAGMGCMKVQCDQVSRIFMRIIVV